MQTVSSFLPYIQITLSLLLIAAVLLQQTGSNVGGAFGGGENFAASFHTRRGFERILFIGTVVIAIIFGLTSLAALLLK